MEVMLMFPHEGQAKYVAKVVMAPDASGALFPVAVHAESGNQDHAALASPGGQDCGVLIWLITHGVARWMHYKRSTRMLYSASPEMILALGSWQLSGNRHRRYLPYPLWDVADDMDEPFREHYVRTEILVPDIPLDLLPQALRYDLYPERLPGISVTAKEFAKLSEAQRLQWMIRGKQVNRAIEKNRKHRIPDTGIVIQESLVLH